MSLQERRARVRQTCQQEIWCRYQGHNLKCRAEDVGRGGARLTGRLALPTGSVVELRPDEPRTALGRRRLTGRVCWSVPRPDGLSSIGVAWHNQDCYAGSWLEWTAPASRGQQRRHRRVPLQLDVTVHSADRTRQSRGESINLCLRGARVRGLLGMVQGHSVLLELHGLRTVSVPARVLRVSHGHTQFGFYSLQSAVQAELEALLRCEARPPGLFQRVLRTLGWG